MPCLETLSGECPYCGSEAFTIVCKALVHIDSLCEEIWTEYGEEEKMICHYCGAEWEL